MRSSLCLPGLKRAPFASAVTPGLCSSCFVYVHFEGVASRSVVIFDKAMNVVRAPESAYS